MIDPVQGDRSARGIGAGYIAAIAGYPNMTVPMGTLNGLPSGIDVMSGAGRDADVLAAGYHYEQATQKIVTPQYFENALSIEEIGTAMRPQRDTHLP